MPPPPPTDDQQMELDMLEAMWGDHYELLNDNKYKDCTFRVDISLSPDDPSEIRVFIGYPAGYPEEAACTASVESISNSRRLQVDGLAKELNEMAESQIGVHAVTLILQRAQDFLFEADAKAKEKPKEKEEVVVKDPTIRMGNALTPELFQEWKVKFDAERAAQKSKQAKAEAAVKAGKLTGRQLWDSTIKKADWELFGADDDDGASIEDFGYTFEAHDEEEEENEGYDLPDE